MFPFERLGMDEQALRSFMAEYKEEEVKSHPEYGKD